MALISATYAALKGLLDRKIKLQQVPAIVMKFLMARDDCVIFLAREWRRGSVSEKRRHGFQAGSEADQSSVPHASLGLDSRESSEAQSNEGKFS